MKETKAQADWLWRAMDALRGVMPLDAMQQFILNMIFLRRVSDVPPEDAQGRPTWAELVGRVPEPDGLDQAVRQALHAWSGRYGELHLDLDEEGTWARPHSGDRRGLDRALRELLLVLDRAGRASAPGELYEQCLAWLSEDRVGGEYYTPRDVVRTMVRLMTPEPGDEVYDPACGSGGMLVEAAHYVRTHEGRSADQAGSGLRLAGRDVNSRTRSIAAMNLVLHGLEGDMLADLGSDNSLLRGSESEEKYGIVLANPPFGMRLARWEDQHHGFTHWRYGPPPKSNADFAWVQHVLGSLRPGGRAAILLANGAAFRGGAERRIRAHLVQDDVLSAVVQLPPGLFPHTRIPACLWLFDTAKRPHAQSRVLFIDAQSSGVQVSRGRRHLTDADMSRIAGSFSAWSRAGTEDEPGWCRVLTREEIEAADHDLQPTRHVTPPVTEADPGDPERRVRELTEELAGHFAEAARIEQELRDVLGMR